MDRHDSDVGHAVAFDTMDTVALDTLDTAAFDTTGSLAGDSTKKPLYKRAFRKVRAISRFGERSGINFCLCGRLCALLKQLCV
jgi:hypothetical protein